MKFKRFMLLILILLFSGCSVDYNVDFNENLSVSEKVNIMIPDSDENYSRAVDLFELNNIPKEDYKVTRVFDEIKIVYTKKYKSIEDYILNSKVYKQSSSKILLNKNDTTTTLSTNINFSDNNLSANKDNNFKIDYLKLSVNSKLPVVSSTADKKEKNKYVWEYNKDSKEKNIKLEFKNQPSFMTYKSVAVIFLIVISSIIIAKIILSRLKDSETI